MQNDPSKTGVTLYCIYLFICICFFPVKVITFQKGGLLVERISGNPKPKVPLFSYSA